MKKQRDWYSGPSSHRQIDRLIKSKSKYLMVSTPYIDDYYLGVLNGVAKRKRVMLVSSKASEKRIRRFMANRVRRFAIEFFLVYLVVMLGWLIVLGGTAGNLIAYLPLAAAALAAVLSKRKRLDVRIIGTGFVHEKLYITENLIITGSANLTYAGTHKNVEHIEIINDAEKIKGIKRHFDRLWSSGYR